MWYRVDAGGRRWVVVWTQAVGGERDAGGVWEWKRKERLPMRQRYPQQSYLHSWYNGPGSLQRALVLLRQPAVVVSPSREAARNVTFSFVQQTRPSSSSRCPFTPSKATGRSGLAVRFH